METFTGRCHCGSLALTFETALDPGTLEPRACQCSFCTRHGARAVSDPAGRVRVLVNDEAQLQRYRFGLATADFILCRRCGVYLAAVMPDAEGAFATVNVNALDQRARFPAGARPFDYDGEDAPTRRARRRSRWTPATITVAARAPGGSETD